MPQATVTVSNEPHKEMETDDDLSKGLNFMVLTQSDLMWASDEAADETQPRIDSIYPAVAQTLLAVPPCAARPGNVNTPAQSPTPTADARHEQQQDDAVGVETRSRAARRAARKQRRTTSQEDSSPVPVVVPVLSTTTETPSPGAAESPAASARADGGCNL